jgi:hypothetical protein
MIIDDLKRINDGPHPRPWSYPENKVSKNNVSSTNIWNMLDYILQQNPNIIVNFR